MAKFTKFTKDEASWTGLGVMSGTSLDGLDLCIVEFTKRQNHWEYSIKDATTVKYPESISKSLRNAHTLSGYDLIKLHIDYGHYIGKSVLRFLQEVGAEIDFVASHGHTIYHQPESGVTFQVGDGETIASHLPCPLVSNFRTKDVALGGQGAPLVPYGEKFLFSEYDYCLNLGGIANISIKETQVGFDVCPCNMILNHFVKNENPDLDYDEDGKLAAQGEIIEELLLKWNSLKFYAEPPPKSIGREWVEQEFLEATRCRSKEFLPKDLLKTSAVHIVQEITDILKTTQKPNQKMLITGGGALNHHLIECLRQEMDKQEVEVSIAEVSKETLEYKEALIFAFLGLLCLQGEANIAQSVTGASQDCIGGSIHLPCI